MPERIVYRKYGTPLKKADPKDPIQKVLPRERKATAIDSKKSPSTKPHVKSSPRPSPMAPRPPKVTPVPVAAKTGLRASLGRAVGATGKALATGAKAVPGVVGKVARGVGKVGKYAIPAGVGAAATYYAMKGDGAKAEPTSATTPSKTPTKAPTKAKSSTSAKNKSSSMFGSDAKEWAASELKRSKEDQARNRAQIAAADKKYEDKMKEIKNRKGKNPFGDF